MELRELTNGKKFYYADEVHKEIDGLKKRIKELENELSELENDKGDKNKNLTPRKPKKTKRVRKEIADRVLNGESKNKLAKEYKLSRGTILNYYKEFYEKEQNVSEGSETIANDVNNDSNEHGKNDVFNMSEWINDNDDDDMDLDFDLSMISDDSEPVKAEHGKTNVIGSIIDSSAETVDTFQRGEMKDGVYNPTKIKLKR